MLYWLGGIVLVALVFIAIVVGYRVLDRGVNGAFSAFAVSEIESDDICSGLFDYCVRVQCKVTNHGPADGDAVVELTIERGDRKLDLSQGVVVPLKVGESKVVAHDFEDATLSDEGARVNCTAK